MKVVFAGYAPLDLAELRRRLPDADVVVAPDDLGEALADADAVVCYRLTADETRRVRRLRLVQTGSAGADGVDRDALPDDAVLCNVRGHERSMAEWVLMAMLALPRQVLRFDRDLREGRWYRVGDERVDLGEPELEGKTIALVGYGQIGRAVEQLVVALDAQTIPLSRRARDGAWPLERLAEALKRADFAVASLPGSAAGLIGERELDALGPTGYLVNVGRGQVVDEDALYTALRERRIAGAAIDVWYRYPTTEGETAMPSRHPFHELENVLMSPHVSGRSRRAARRRWEFIVAQLERLARGEPLENVIG
ncbi:MAG: hypothetical protein ICV59_07260 [Thermoleophilia bacterium]|nr:hypothetical protein [Thermoleophilia bacterium]